MKKMWPALIATALAGPALGQASQVLYAAGRMMKDQQISVKNWGSGSIAETDEIGLEGNRSIRVSTRNYFQGGVVQFGEPQDLSQEFGDKNNLLKVTFRLADENLVINRVDPSKDPNYTPNPGETFAKGKRGGTDDKGQGNSNEKGKGGSDSSSGPGGAGKGGAGKGGAGSGGKGGGGLAGGPAGGGMGGPGVSGGRPGGGGPGTGSFTGGKGGGGAKANTKKPLLKTMRFIVTTTDGLKSEAYVPVNSSSVNDRLWREVAIPLSAINGFERTNRIVKEIALSGDTTSTFYVGDIRVVNDQTPITGDIMDVSGDLNLALGDTVLLVGEGYGGASPLKFTWDFDATDGIQIDSEGQAIRHKFRKPGTYEVTMTIIDMYGLKTPFSKSFKVKVNP